MPLTDTKIRNARRRENPYKLADRDGLYLLVTSDGRKYWRFEYRRTRTANFQRADGTKRPPTMLNSLSLGVYPDVGLKTARKRRLQVREEVAAGLDPSRVRKAETRRTRIAAANTFEAVAREWFAKETLKLAPATVAKQTWILDTFLIPALGRLPMTEVEPPALLEVFQKVEHKGRHATAHRVKQVASAVFRYAVATGRVKRDLTMDLRGALKAVVTTSHPAVTEPAKIGALMRAIDAFEGSVVVHAALRLAPLVFVRPGELRHAKWSDIDLDRAQWRIPREQMKGREPHIVPLSKQAVAVLRALEPVTAGEDKQYVFPHARTRRRPMSENTLNAALRRLGYDQTEMVAHGFRTTASTRLNEMGWRPDVIERQLAHIDRSVRGVYNRAFYLTERAEMMQAWADELDRLRVNVVSIQRAG